MASRRTCLASVSPATSLKVRVLCCIMVSSTAAWRLVGWGGRSEGGVDKDSIVCVWGGGGGGGGGGEVEKQSQVNA